jgi:hypothetical protein
MRIRLGFLRAPAIFLIASVLTLSFTKVAFARVFFCASGDVFCLIGSIRSANERRGADTIILAAGTYTLTAVNNTEDSATFFSAGNGLPSVTRRLTIVGAGPGQTIIERAEEGVPAFRIVHVAASGRLTLHGVTIQGGVAQDGAGIFNRGTLTISDSEVRENHASFGIAGGILNMGTLKIINSRITGNFIGLAPVGGIASFGSLHIVRSTIDHNSGETGGGIDATGTTIIQDSTISDNGAHAGTAGIAVEGNATITDTTIANNTVSDPGGTGGLSAAGTARLTNVTVADNRASTFPFSQSAAGIAAVGEGTQVFLQNTIVARNTALLLLFGTIVASDCQGSIISLGNNIIGDTAGCTIDLASTDFVGDPGLGQFVDDGTPGHGRIPLLAESPAIDAGNRAACSRRDQLGNRRVDVDGDRPVICDIGAVEFVP